MSNHVGFPVRENPPLELPRTSVPVAAVITAHGRATYLEQALDSVRAQTTVPAEVVVVDDTSPESNAPAILRAVGVQSVRHATSPNLARNAAILQVRQPWIAFLDADDLWLPHKLETQWRAVEACPDIGTVFTNLQEFNEDGPLPTPFFERKPHYWVVDRQEVAPGIKRCGHESLVRQFLLGNILWRSTLLVRRDLLVQVGLFDPELVHLEDRDCWLRLLTVSEMAVIEEPLMWSRTDDPADATRRLWEYETALDGIKLSERILADPGRYPRGTMERYAVDRWRWHLNAGRFSEDQGDLAAARRFYLQAWWLGGGLRPVLLAGSLHLPATLRRALKTAIRRSRRLAAA